MKRSEFSFQLPRELIAQYPLPERSASRLLCLDGESGEVVHRQFREILDLLRPDDLRSKAADGALVTPGADA